MLRLRSCYLCLFTLLLSLCSVQGAQAGSAPYSEAGALNSLEAQREGTVDADGDGFSPYFSDCDDNDASIYPGAIDPLGDRIDQDCGGRDGPQPSVGLPNSAFDSIAEAIAAALPRETVWVGPGTYYEGDMVISTGNMIIAGTHGPAETTVDGLGFDSIFTVDASTSLRGLHLVNARHSIELVFSLAYMYLEELIVETGSGDKSNSIYVSMGGLRFDV